jgi:hypothetical protein
MALLVALCLPLEELAEAAGTLLGTLEACLVWVQAIASTEVLTHMARQGHKGVLCVLEVVLRQLSED